MSGTRVHLGHLSFLASLQPQAGVGSHRACLGDTGSRWGLQHSSWAGVMDEAAGGAPEAPEHPSLLMLSHLSLMQTADDQPYDSGRLVSSVHEGDQGASSGSWRGCGDGRGPRPWAPCPGSASHPQEGVPTAPHPAMAWKG